MEFRILGPLEILDEGRAVTLGGSEQRALSLWRGRPLAALANEPFAHRRDRSA